MAIDDPEVVAEWRIRGKTQEGVFLDIHLSIGRPTRRRGDHWACPIGISPLVPGSRSISGLGPIQALALALVHMRQVLEQFRRKGGVLLSMTDDSEIPLDSIFGLSV